MSAPTEHIEVHLDDGYKWRAFSAIALSFFTMVMTMSMVFVALSAIADDFGVSLRSASWVVISEALVISALLLPMGRFADIVGRKKIHMSGLAIFAVGAVLVAFAPTFWALILARIVMATGNAMSQSVGTAMVVAIFPAAERGKAIGSQTTAVSVGGASGPIVAGLLLEVLPWEALFLLLLIPVSIAFVAAHFLLDEERVSAGRDQIDGPFDWGGAIMSGLMVIVVVLTINNPLAASWFSPIILGGVALVGGLLTAFIRWELNRDDPMLQLRLFKIPTFRLAVGTRLLGFMGSTTTRFLLPIFLISLRGMNEGAAGGLLFLISLGMGISAQSCGRLSDRVGTRPFTIVGLALLAATGLAMGFMTASTNTMYLAVIVFISGLANGMWNVPNNSTILGSVPPADLGVIGAFTNLTRTLGNVFGQAIASTVVVAVMVSQGFDIPLKDIDDIVGADTAFTDGWRVAHFLLTGYALAALALAIRTRPGTPLGQASAKQVTDTKKRH
ncbi:MAG: MFS transporter [Acidimicrobiales bacterium]|jgi:MFS family permease